jgi:hypothetical protein
MPRHAASQAANMDTLIIFGTSCAYLYSVISLVYSIAIDADKPPMLFLDTGPMLFTFVAFGRFLEHVAKGRTSEALSKLMNLQPPEVGGAPNIHIPNTASKTAHQLCRRHKCSGKGGGTAFHSCVDQRAAFQKCKIAELLI